MDYRVQARQQIVWAWAFAVGVASFALQGPLAAEQTAAAQAQAARPCRALGRVTSGDLPLPGATVTIKTGEKVVAVTSSDLDGSYTVPLAPGTYTLRAELTAFASVDREITLGAPPCETTLDLKTQLLSRTPGAAPLQVAPAPAPAGPRAGAPGAPAAAGPGGAQPGGRGGRGGGVPRFQTLTVQQSSDVPPAGDAVVDLTSVRTADDPAARLLPPGFSMDASLESVAVSGTMVELDRTQMNDRMQALGRGEFGLAEGQLGAGAPQLAGAIGDGQLGGAGGGRAGGGPGGAGGGGLLGGRGGGRGGLQVSATYGAGGSMFDAAPYALRGEAPSQRDYLQQSFSTTVGGPVVIPGLYNGTNRTTFNFTYSGGRNTDLFDQYATVPNAAFRAGDFSRTPAAIIDPLTGQPFAGNQIPFDRISPTALALMQYIPEPTLSGDTRNFRRTTNSNNTTDSFSVRITHSITTPPVGRGGRGGAAGAAGGRGGRAGGAPPATATPGAATPAAGTPAATTPAAGAATTPAAGTAPTGAAAAPAGTAAAGAARAGQPGAQAAGRGGQAPGGGRGGRGNFQPPLNVTMNATLNYRRNDGDRPSVYPLLSGQTQGSTFSVPVTVNMRAGRSMHAFSFSFNRTQSETRNAFAYNVDVAGNAGITGIATDPFDWGVPTLTFGTFSSLRDVAPTVRTDRSMQTGYTWTRTFGTHSLRAGGSFQHSVNDSRSDANARGSYTFTGLYTNNGAGSIRGSGQDFADFLLGMPQQATRQYSESLENIAQSVALRGKQFSAYFGDDWRWKARWTINYGVNYDVLFPFTEANGNLVNLDANADFTAVQSVMAGQTGAFSGEYPAGLVKTDWNNLSPRVGAAWRATNRSVVRFGYGLSYNSGSYSTIARQLSQQPPFFLTGTSLGTLDDPLLITEAFSNISPSTVTNSYGIDENYAIGLIHQWTFDYGRDLFRSWNVGATYIGTRGSHLDILRAPNRGPDGLRIPDVQSFTWQSAEGSSYMNGLALRVQKRQTRGISGSASYTFSKSRDNTTATGGGASVAQDDRNLDAEWALSNFDRRHQLSGNVAVQLPWGTNRQWLSEGGWLASIVGGWSMNANLTVQTGTPLTARCSTCASDVARGTGGTLRANYTGLPIDVDDRSIDGFFNPLAFSIPSAGTFGNSPRNVIIGPGSRLLNASFTRDVALGGNRNVSISVNANNLFNMVNYAGVDTNVNSPTFGQILSVRGMRTVRLNLRFRF